MKNDPIVKEVREARAKIFAECDNDLEKLMDRYAASENANRDKLVTKEMLDSRGGDQEASRK